jgi:hypothetical protein
MADRLLEMDHFNNRAPEQNSGLELTILMPCLNEAETLGICIRKATAFLKQNCIAGEVLVADNGSMDGSPKIATKLNARVVQVPMRGYGAALQGGLAAAHGKYVIMGDCDCSYDFSSLNPFVERLRQGADLVMGNRFKGGIDSGAMPLLHRYVGNPILSFIARLFFRIKIGDFHCGLRGFNRDRIQALNLTTTGMEFASEMVVRAGLAGYWIDEVPTRLAPDGRSRPPHLRTWRDGWRHLRFLLLYSPRWLFLYPGLFLLVLGVFGILVQLTGPIHIGSVVFDINTFVASCFAILISLQGMAFALLARRLATRRGLLPRSERFDPILELVTLERMLLLALVLIISGFLGAIWSFVQWAGVAFGDLDYPNLQRFFLLSLTSIAAGILIAFTSFLASVIDLAPK